nr:MAG TPA: hypothetical protein [Caudoviricetes sp.]
MNFFDRCLVRLASLLSRCASALVNFVRLRAVVRGLKERAKK